MELSQAPVLQKSVFCCRKPRKILPQILVALTTSLLYVCSGACRAWPSPVIPALLSHQDFQFDSSDAGWTVSLLSLSGWLGLFTVYPLQRFGRRSVMLVLGVLILIGLLLLGLAYQKYMLFVGRIILGGSIQGVAVSCQIYISECASPHIRGSLTSIMTFATNIGMLLVYILGSFVEWYELGLILSAMPILFVTAILFTPESPIWLLTRGRHTDASKALQRLRGPFTSIEAELKKMQDKIQADEVVQSTNRQTQSIWREFLRRPVWYPFLLTFCVMSFVPLSGTPILIMYLGYVFEQAAIGWNGNKASIIVGVAQLLGVTISGTLVDRAGRRVLLMISGTGMSLTQLTLATYFYFSEIGTIDKDSKLGWLPVTAVTAYCLSLSVGFSSIPQMLMGEMFPTQLRSLLCSCCVTLAYFVVFLVAYTYPMLASGIGQSCVFYIYGSFAALSVVFVYVFLPETRGKTLAQIEEIFTSHSKPAEIRKSIALTDPDLVYSPEKYEIVNATFENDGKKTLTQTEEPCTSQSRPAETRKSIALTDSDLVRLPEKYGIVNATFESDDDKT